jgi:hypothetical protein
MRLYFFLIAYFITTSLSIAQVRWLLEPTQDSKHFVTPQIEGLDFIIVKYEDRTSKVVNSKGKTLVERDRIFWPISFSPNDRLVAFSRENEKFKFYNQDFECVTEGFDEAHTQADYNTLITTKNGLLGLIDIEGNVLIENKYKLLKRIATGKFKAITEDGEEKVLTIEDIPNTRHFPNCTYNGMTIYRSLFCDRLSSLGITDNNSDTLLHLGKFYSSYYPRCPKIIKDSFIMVASPKTKNVGLINLKGELVVDTIYKSINQVDSSPYLFNVKIGKSNSVLDIRTQKATKYGYDDAYVMKSYISVKKGEFRGKLDFEGNLEIPPTYNTFRTRDSSIAYQRNDSIYINSTKKNAFAKDVFAKNATTRSQTYVLENYNKKYCLYDGGNLEFLTDTIYTNIRQVGNYFECTYITFDTTYYDPPKEIKNRKGEVTRTYSSTTRKVYNYEFRDLDGKLMYGPIQRELKILNGRYSKHYIPKTDSVAFVNTQTFQAQKFLSSEVDNVKYGVGYFVKDVIHADSSSYILDHFLDPSIEAIPYDTLMSEDRSPVYIYRQNNKYGLLSKDAILTEPKFESIERRSDQFIVALNRKYGLLEVVEDEE